MTADPRLRALTRDEKLALLARAAEHERRARAARVADAAESGAVLRVPGSAGRPLLFFLSEDDLAL